MPLLTERNVMENCFICPAYYLEARGFNPTHQPKNRIIKEIAARIIALVAPVLYLYQIALHGVVSVIDVVLLLLGCSPGIICQRSIPSVCYSFKNLFSSVFEIPEKLIFGPRHQPNYFGNAERYKQIDFLNQRFDLI